MKRTFLVSYNWQSYAGGGPGHTFAVAPGEPGMRPKLTQDLIEQWIDQIRRRGRYDSVVITGLVELEE